MVVILFCETCCFLLSLVANFRWSIQKGSNHSLAKWHKNDKSTVIGMFWSHLLAIYVITNGLSSKHGNIYNLEYRCTVINRTWSDLLFTFDTSLVSYFPTNVNWDKHTHTNSSCTTGDIYVNSIMFRLHWCSWIPIFNSRKNKICITFGR